MDPAGDRLVDRYALVLVRNGEVVGLPRRAPSELEEIIKIAAESVERGGKGASSSSYRVGSLKSNDAETDAIALRPIAFSNDDLVFGGEHHRELLNSVLRTSKKELIIHSTFIDEGKFGAIRPLLSSAAQRGVQVHILWGEGDEKSLQSQTKQSVLRFRQELATAGLNDAIQIHPFSTRSHAKIIIADNGRANKHVAIVGSCNWLSSGFHSYECSARIRDPLLVSDVIDQLAELSRGLDGHWTDLTSYFARSAVSFRGASCYDRCRYSRSVPGRPVALFPHRRRQGRGALT
jgi:cardiolipin synthase A/B